jgi:hypothetical protein
MSEPESPQQDAEGRAPPATQDPARDRADLRRAIDEYERIAKLHRLVTMTLVTVYGDHVTELPHAELEKKLNADALLLQEATEILGHQGQMLVDIARKLEGYVPSSDPKV